MIKKSKSLKKRIFFFNFVRDIPYHNSIHGEQEYSCGTKTDILKKLLQSIRIKSREILCQFNWEDLGLPKNMLRHHYEKPEYHQFLEVFIPETKKWVAVDPTWDIKLKKKFQISSWDGITSTNLAVKPIKIFSVSETKKLNKKFDNPEIMKAYLERNRPFFIEMNKYLEKVRKS
ncbi:hypothetical protein KY308_04340 [Candidatus Woesearchaeota archaeon]|nr:hypothetical protein [Candidatus Woesearchaeota archaeon]